MFFHSMSVNNPKTDVVAIFSEYMRDYHLERESVQIIEELMDESSDFYKKHVALFKKSKEVDNKQQVLLLWHIHNEHRKRLSAIASDDSKNDYVRKK